MRKSLKQAPTLKSTPSPFPVLYQKSLLDPSLNRGGIILVSGGAGCGKTTTASAVLVSRLMQHGGVAFTVEDPPEHPLNGWHDSGYCWQTSVVGSGQDADWTRSMQFILRSQPVGTNQMLFVGEIRTSEAAQMMVRAANNGFLVITTSFGSSLPSALEAFCSLVGKEHIQAFASMIRIVIYQTIVGDRFSVDFLTSDNPTSKVAQLIKALQFAQLRDELNFQRNRALLNENGL
jgi:twitching motility protein PilT